MGEGRLIVIEGLDSVGKTTLINNLKKKFGKNSNYVFTEEPGGTAPGKEIRKILENWHLDDMTRFYLFKADRIDHLNHVVLPALKQGKTVICSRFIYTALIYQFSKEIKLEESYAKTIADLPEFDYLEKKIELILLCDTVDNIRKRLSRRETLDSLELDVMKNIEERRERYIDMVNFCNENEKVKSGEIVNICETPKQTFDKVIELLRL